MKLLFLGDVVGNSGTNFVLEKIPAIKKQYNIDITVINGENSADGNGITPVNAEKLLSVCDCITTGNHCYKRMECRTLFQSHKDIIRPANYPDGAYGRYYYVIDKGYTQIAVINMLGTVNLLPLDNPFNRIDEILCHIEHKGIHNIILDFHAEATAEKKAMGKFLDGRVTAVLGTHTHVPTADECIQPNGTAYITDVGMCGPEDSVLGVESQIIIHRFRSYLPSKFVTSTNPPFICGVIVDFDHKTGKANSIERITVR